MSQIQLEFTPEDNIKSFPEPISGKYEMQQLVIEATSLKGLTEAIREMRIYFRFDFGSPLHNFTRTYHLSNYIFGMDSLNYTIKFNEKALEITPNSKCTQAVASIQDEVLAPVTKMTLILNHIESK